MGELTHETFRNIPPNEETSDHHLSPGLHLGTCRDIDQSGRVTHNRILCNGIITEIRIKLVAHHTGGIPNHTFGGGPSSPQW